MEITAVLKPDKTVLDGINALLPQLTPTCRPLTARQFDRLVASSCCRIYIAMEDGQVLGMLTLAIYPIPTDMRARIEDLVVDEGARGKGIARKMIQRALEHAKRAGADTVNLTSHDHRKAANALYRRMGFEFRETNAYRTPVEQTRKNLSKEKKI